MREVKYLGSLKEWLKPLFEEDEIVIQPITEREKQRKYIPVYLNATGDITLKFYCTKTLSDQIREGEVTRDQLINSLMVKVVVKNKTYIRLTHFLGAG
jgi:hypothetical protein